MDGTFYATPDAMNILEHDLGRKPFYKAYSQSNVKLASNLPSDWDQFIDNAQSTKLSLNTLNNNYTWIQDGEYVIISTPNRKNLEIEDFEVDDEQIRSPVISGKWSAPISECSIVFNKDYIDISFLIDEKPNILIKGGEADPQSAYVLAMVSKANGRDDCYQYWLNYSVNRGFLPSYKEKSNNCELASNEEEQMYWYARSVLEYHDIESAQKLAKCLKSTKSENMDTQLSDYLLALAQSSENTEELIDELRQSEENERLKGEEERKLEEERLRAEEEEKRKKLEEERKRREEEERKQKEEERKRREKEEEERRRKEEEERQRIVEEELRKEQERLRVKQEEEEAKLKQIEEEERLQREEEERLQREEEERLQREEEERLQREEEERLQREEEERALREIERELIDSCSDPDGSRDAPAPRSGSVLQHLVDEWDRLTSDEDRPPSLGSLRVCADELQLSDEVENDEELRRKVRRISLARALEEEDEGECGSPRSARARQRSPTGRSPLQPQLFLDGPLWEREGRRQSGPLRQEPLVPFETFARRKEGEQRRRVSDDLLARRNERKRSVEKLRQDVSNDRREADMVVTAKERGLPVPAAAERERAEPKQISLSPRPKEAKQVPPPPMEPQLPRVEATNVPPPKAETTNTAEAQKETEAPIVAEVPKDAEASEAAEERSFSDEEPPTVEVIEEEPEKEKEVEKPKIKAASARSSIEPKQKPKDAKPSRHSLTRRTPLTPDTLEGAKTARPRPAKATTPQKAKPRHSEEESAPEPKPAAKASAAPKAKAKAEAKPKTKETPSKIPVSSRSLFTGGKVQPVAFHTVDEKLVKKVSASGSSSSITFKSNPPTPKSKGTESKKVTPGAKPTPTKQPKASATTKPRASTGKTTAKTATTTARRVPHQPNLF